jgi:hypothetical protein
MSQIVPWNDPGEAPCCCEQFVCQSGTSVWGFSGQLPINQQRILAYGVANQFSTDYPESASAAELISFLNNGGLLCLKTEFPGGGGFATSIMNNFLASIGSSLSLENAVGGFGWWGLPFPGYSAIIENNPLNTGLGANVPSIGATGKINGGTPLLVAPDGSSSGSDAQQSGSAVCVATESIGAGIVLLAADSNIDVCATQRIAFNAAQQLGISIPPSAP